MKGRSYYLCRQTTTLISGLFLAALKDRYFENCSPLVWTCSYRQTLTLSTDLAGAQLFRIVNIYLNSRDCYTSDDLGLLGDAYPG
jgi:hypothetical protein